MFLAKRSVLTAPLSGLFHVEQGLFHHQMPQRLFHVEQSAQEQDPGQGTSTSIRSERAPRVDDYRLTEKVARGAAESYLPLAGGEMNQLRASRTVSGSGTHGTGASVFQRHDALLALSASNASGRHGRFKIENCGSWKAGVS